MTTIYSFPPIVPKQARILILGSMPGQASLDANQYYAHPRNSFWFILEHLFSKQKNMEYEQRRQMLMDNHIAVWDVLQACVRPGSLDSAIDSSSIVANDFVGLFTQQPTITHVFFNGARAHHEYDRHVLALVTANFSSLNYKRLPSTSPAHAAMSREKKMDEWKVVKMHALQCGVEPKL